MMTKIRSTLVQTHSLARYAENLGLKKFIKIGYGLQQSGGISTKILEDVFEAFVGEAVIQNIMHGKYVDVTDVMRSFKHEHFRNVVLEYAKKYSIG